MRRRDAQPDPEVLRALEELDAALAAEPGADPDLVAFTADVRAARPVADPAFLARLDERAAAGFAAAPAATPRRRRALRPLLGGLAVAACVAVGAVVVTQGDDDAGGGSLASRPEAAVTDSAASSAGAAADESAAAPDAARQAAPSGSVTPPAVVAPPAGRSVERSAQLSLTPEPDELQRVADGVVRATQALGGYVADSQVQVQPDGGSAAFTLRVPTARLDEILARLSRLGPVANLSQAATDITAPVASAEDRLSDARATRRALLRALGKATAATEIERLRSRLRDTAQEIAGRSAALDAVRRRATLATVTVDVQGVTATPGAGGGSWSPGDALHDAGRVLEVVAGVALVGLAVLVPVGLLGALAWVAARGARRRRREAVLDGQ